MKKVVLFQVKNGKEVICYVNVNHNFVTVQIDVKKSKSLSKCTKLYIQNISKYTFMWLCIDGTTQRGASKWRN